MRIYIEDWGEKGKSYKLIKTIHYHSKRYNKNVTVLAGTRSDGATGAYDINSSSWWVHDELCIRGRFDGGSLCTNWQASRVLSDILKSEGYWFRSRTWFVMTFLFGGGRARKNGMFRL